VKLEILLDTGSYDACTDSLAQSVQKLWPIIPSRATIRVRGGGWGGMPPPGLNIIRASASCSKIMNHKKYIQYSEFRTHYSVFQGKRKLLKNPECKKYIQHTTQWGISKQTLFFRASESCSKILNVKIIFNLVYSVYIHLGVIRVIWASVVCNLDQSRDWYSDFDLDQALVFCKNRIIWCR